MPSLKYVSRYRITLAIPASRFPFSGPRSKMRLARKCRHVIIQLPSIKAILRQRSAKIIASWLHYVCVLMRIVCSDNHIASIMATMPVSTNSLYVMLVNVAYVVYYLIDCCLMRQI